MKIEITYNGSLVTCKINGKYVHKASNEEVTRMFTAFDAVRVAYIRDAKTLAK